MCKNDWKSVDFLLIHFPSAFDLWSFILSLFGTSRVMPKQVVELVACWHRGVGRHRSAFVLDVILQYIM